MPSPPDHEPIGIPEDLVPRITTVTEKEQEEEQPPFLCPLCESTAYGPIVDWVLVRFGKPLPVIAYACDGCSVVFRDPEKFSARSE